MTLSAAALSLLAVAALGAEPPPLAAGDPLPGYALTYDRDKWSEQFSVFQMSLSDDWGTLKSTLAAADDPRLRPLTRLDTAMSFSAPFIHAPTRLGDTVSSSAFWDQPVRIGGLQIGTLQPTLPDIAPPALLPAADPFTLPGAPAIASSRFIDHVNSVARLQRPTLAATGQSDYSLEVGRVRQDFEFKSNRYGGWLASGTYRLGISPATTLDGQFAQLGGQQSLFGIGVLEGLGRFGQLSARFANSRDADGRGWLARMGYDYERDNLSVALRTHIQSPGYQLTGDIAAIEPLRQRTLASAGWDFGSIGSFSVASATQTFSDDTRRDVVAFSHAVALLGGGVLSTAAAYAPGEIASSALFLSVTYPFGAAATGARALRQQIDITLDRTIGDALQNRMFGYPRAPSGAAPDLGSR